MAYHFGWSHDKILALPHWERHRWCNEISDINDKRNHETSGPDRTDSGGIEFINPDFEG